MTQRENELRLLAEYEKAGKITVVGYRSPEEISLTVEEEEALEENLLNGKRTAEREPLGDGNFRLGGRPKE